MGFTVRDLLPRIECMRPDLKMGEPERLTIAKAKHLMRECYLGHQTSLVYPVKAGVNQLLLSPDVKFKNPVTNGSLPSIPDIMVSAFGASVHVDANKEIVPCVYGGAKRAELPGIMDKSFNKLPAKLPQGAARQDCDLQEQQCLGHVHGIREWAGQSSNGQ